MATSVVAPQRTSLFPIARIQSAIRKQARNRAATLQVARARVGERAGRTFPQVRTSDLPERDRERSRCKLLALDGQRHLPQHGSLVRVVSARPDSIPWGAPPP